MFEESLEKIMDSLLGKKETKSELHTEDEILEDICMKIGNGSELQMEKRIHDIIIKNVEYEDGGRKEDHEKTGPILTQKGVCDGISKLADTLFKMKGMESSLVYGVLCMGGEVQGPHAWNQVRIDGAWYHIDITEDLAISDGRLPYRYDYFNLSDYEISIDHVIKISEHQCITSGRGYYELNNLYVNNIREFKQIMIDCLKKEGSLTVKLPRVRNPREMEERLNDHVMEYCKTIYNKRFSIESVMNPDQMVYSVRVV